MSNDCETCGGRGYIAGPDEFGVYDGCDECSDEGPLDTAAWVAIHDDEGYARGRADVIGWLESEEAREIVGIGKVLTLKRATDWPVVLNTLHLLAEHLRKEEPDHFRSLLRSQPGGADRGEKPAEADRPPWEDGRI